MSLTDVIKSNAATDGEGAAFAAALAAAKVDQLIGVTADGAKALSKIGVTTVFDLAYSDTFNVAAAIAAAARDVNHPLSRAQRVPDAWVVAALDGASPEVVATSPAESLETLKGHLTHAELVGTLGVATVADLAHWPAFGAARRLVDAALGSENGAESQEGPGTPPDLQPANGVYPTEVMYYERLFLDSFLSSSAAKRSDLVTAGALRIADAAARTTGFDTVAQGALVTFSQSWHGLGLSLGQLLHSIALAPGESVRIAMVDWSRRTAGQRGETGSEDEQLANTTEHARAISEVASVVATEQQTGQSTAGGSATTEQGGVSGGIGPVGGTYSKGATTTTGRAWSTSSGSRSIGADTSQSISETTQQAAAAVRNRRATVVQETEESESSTATTRVVANYNHMHALTVQYYEVVQVFSVRTQVASVTRCLFVPIALEDFDELPTGRDAAIVAGATLDAELRGWLWAAAGGIRLKYPPPPPAPDGDDLAPAQLWDESIAHAGRSLTSAIPAVRTYSDELAVPAGASLVEVAAPSLAAGDVITAELHDGRQVTASVRAGRARFKTAVAMDQLNRVTLSSKSADPLGTVDLVIDDGSGTRGVLSNRSAMKADAVASPLLATSQPLTAVERIDALARLKTERLRYNQALWSAIDNTTLAVLLADYDFEGRSVMEQIDPTPIGLAGNYLVFKMNTQPDDEYARTDPVRKPSTPAELWHQWLHDHGLEQPVPSSEVVALPSGGVFAEAVLGRSNSAELLDLSRFWNWQDSPIPLQPTEILPPSTESRAGEVDLKPGQFAAPMVNIVAPTTLPDPTGMRGILGAVAQGNMFRDMSGLDLAANLAGTALESSTAAAGSAGKISAENYAEMNRHKEAIFDRFLQLYGKGGGSGSAAPANRNISTAGAAINHGQQMDRAAAGSNGASNGSVTTGGGGSSAGGEGATGLGDQTGSAEGAAFRQAIGDDPGAPSGSGEAPSGGGGAPGLMGPFAKFVASAVLNSFGSDNVQKLLAAAKKWKLPLTQEGAEAIYEELSFRDLYRLADDDVDDATKLKIVREATVTAIKKAKDPKVKKGLEDVLAAADKLKDGGTP